MLQRMHGWLIRKWSSGIFGRAFHPHFHNPVWESVFSLHRQHWILWGGKHFRLYCGQQNGFPLLYGDGGIRNSDFDLCSTKLWERGLPACKAGNQTFPYHYTVCGAWTDALCSFAWEDNGFYMGMCFWDYDTDCNNISSGIQAWIFREDFCQPGLLDCIIHIADYNLSSYDDTSGCDQKWAESHGWSARIEQGRIYTIDLKD